MNFTISCDKASPSVTCLLTGKPNAHPTLTRAIIHRVPNLLTGYLPLSIASVGLLSNDLWLTGHELGPGVNVLDSPFSASEIHPVTDFPTDPETTDNNSPDFQQLKAMHIPVHNTKKKLLLVIQPLVSCRHVLLSRKPISATPSNTQVILFVYHWILLIRFFASPHSAQLLHNKSFTQRVPVQPRCPKHGRQEIL